MNKKLFVLAPLCVLAITSCGGGSSESTPKTYASMDEFLAAFENGSSVEKTEAVKILEENVLGSNDSKITFASKNYTSYMPLSAYAGGLEDSEYANIVNKSNITETFKKYSDGLIETGIDYEKYGYDKNNADDEELDGLSSEPVAYLGTAFIDVDEDAQTIDYTYTQDGEATNSYSFTQSGELNDTRKEMLDKTSSLAGLVAQAYDDVTSQFAYYAGAWADDDLTPVETFEAKKTDNGGFSLEFKGDLCMNLYSAERLWGFTYDEDDEDYENPLSRESNMFNGMYVDRRIRFSFSLDISADGFIDYCNAIYFSYWTTLYKDTLYEKGDPVPSYPLSAETIAELTSDPNRLVVPETLTRDDGSTVENPYTGSNYDDYLPYEMDYYKTGGVDYGTYEGTLPNPDDYREQDGTDKGAWISALDLFEEIW